jgi:hypothetical protein
MVMNVLRYCDLSFLAFFPSIYPRPPGSVPLYKPPLVSNANAI